MLQVAAADAADAASSNADVVFVAFLLLMLHARSVRCTTYMVMGYQNT